MPRPKLPSTMETVSARLTRDMVAAIDAYLEEMREDAPLLLLNRADAVRQLLAIGLQSESRRKGRGTLSRGRKQ